MAAPESAATVAVLAPDNNRIDRVAAALADAELPVDDSLLRTGSATSRRSQSPRRPARLPRQTPDGSLSG